MHISLKEQIRAEAQGGTPLEGQDGSLTGGLLQGGCSRWEGRPCFGVGLPFLSSKGPQAHQQTLR